MISVNGRCVYLINEISGYQELKLILTDMKKRKCQKIEMEYEILLKLLHELQRLKYQKNVLLDENEKLKDKAEVGQLKEKQSSFLIIIDVLGDLKDSGAWIEYKNKTANTKEFYRIDKEVLEKVVDEKTADNIETKNILNMMANLGIIRKQDNKILFSASIDGVPKRIYMIRKDSVDFLERAGDYVYSGISSGNKVFS